MPSEEVGALVVGVLGDELFGVLQRLLRLGVSAGLQVEDEEPLPLGGLVGEGDRLVHVGEEVLGGGGVHGELVVRHGEGGVFRRGLLEELPAVMGAELLGELATIEIERLRLVGRGGEGTAPLFHSAAALVVVAAEVVVALADSVSAFLGLQAVTAPSVASVMRYAADEGKTRGMRWSSGGVSDVSSS